MRKILKNIWNKLKPLLIETGQLPYEIKVIAENLEIPWAIAISSEGKIYFTERTGSIRIIENGKLLSQPLISLSQPFISQGEGGLMGIALDPNFTNNRYIYIMHSYLEDNRIYNRVVRLVEKSNRATIDQIILDRIPGGQIHNGGRIKIGPDQKLYIATGDGGNPEAAQDLNRLAGKILRLELDGRIPIDNPITNSPVFSLGHRNPQGLAWNSKNVMYASEHGSAAHDEINIIKPGGNYGWPLVQGDDTTAQVTVNKPLLHSGNETWAPSGIALISQGPWQGKLLVAALRGQRLLALTLNSDGTAVTNIESFFRGDYGRLRDVVQDREGSIYLATSNRDGRGRIGAGDDKIIQLVPRLQMDRI